MLKIVISTDLDGTLIDHHDYSFSAALPALQACKEVGVPILFNTSKNVSEVQALQQQMQIDAAFIVENGSALIIDKERHIFGVERREVLLFIASFVQAHGNVIEGFNDWSVEQLVEQTGLSPSAAKLAMQKEYSEPFLWHGDESQLQLLIELANEQNLTLTKGGRFYHLQGQCDKATPLSFLRANPSNINSGATSLKLVCLGDNHNDAAMLAIADIAVCVKSPVADYPHFEALNPQQRIYTKQCGPEGWNIAVEEILACPKSTSF